MNKKTTKLIDQIMECASLAALGNAKLTDEEREALTGLRGFVNEMMQAEKVVLDYEKNGDLESAIKKYEKTLPKDLGMSLQFLDDEGEVADEISLPNMIDTDDITNSILTDARVGSLIEKRNSCGSLEGVVEFEKQVANKLKDKYLQKVAVITSLHVIAAEETIFEGEIIALNNMCDAWGLDISETASWYLSYVVPIINEYEIPGWVLSILGLDAPIPEENPVQNDTIFTRTYHIDARKNSVQNDILFTRTYEIDARKNSIIQFCVCLALVSAADGEISDEEVEGFEVVMNIVAKIYGLDQDQDPMDYLSDAIHNVILKAFDKWEAVPHKFIHKLAKKSAKKITDKYLQRSCAFLAWNVACMDGFDDLEHDVLNVLLKVWKITPEELESYTGVIPLESEGELNNEVN